MTTTLRIPLTEVVKAYDEIVDLGKSFSIDIDKDADDVVINGNDNELLDFLIAYHDVDMQAAKETYAKYATKNVRKSFTPEAALKKVDEFILANGCFEDYDIVYEALHNAIHGIV